MRAKAQLFVAVNHVVFSAGSGLESEVVAFGAISGREFGQKSSEAVSKTVGAPTVSVAGNNLGCA